MFHAGARVLQEKLGDNIPADALAACTAISNYVVDYVG